MSDQGHIDALREAETRGGRGLAGGFTEGFRWLYIVVGIVVLATLVYAAYRFTWPASYSGQARWNEDYTTLTLVGSGLVLDVAPDTELVNPSGDATSIERLRSQYVGVYTAPFTATVIWRPYGKRTATGQPAGVTQTIERR